MYCADGLVYGREVLLLFCEANVGSCWLYGDRFRTDRFDEADVSLSLDEGRRLCLEEERPWLGDEERGTGDR
jgi:hypothetical protein